MDYSYVAEHFIDAIAKLADTPANLDNLEIYLSHHFGEWLTKYANTPECITAELQKFANMNI